ncbi:TRAP transporter small permease [Ureibacillus acetophenoni]|uniref:TRAP-type C4-dicarboxylate transport system permease small subunit n=1 Tax=Ureibacillus acetophenoni TaxID=614649 RepID=A0A285UEX2_9BACL|nr:TRAP transporter small permease [Ureibacillus acetophenoni]SOC40227.1 TRAP-type C4-dicarboxylate transport system permease small subunit [Ureibacillus acetophenoni]
MTNLMNKTLDTVENVLAAVAGIFILLSMFTIVLEVIVRSTIGHSFVWVQEYNEYLLLYIPFLAGAWLLRNNDHVVINLIDNILGKSSTVLNVIVAVLGFIAMAVLFYYSTIVTIDIFERGVKSTTVLRTPQVYIYIVIPIGSLLMALEFLRTFFKAIYLKKNHEGKGEL